MSALFERKESDVQPPMKDEDYDYYDE